MERQNGSGIDSQNQVRESKDLNQNLEDLNVREDIRESIVSLYNQSEKISEMVDDLTKSDAEAIDLYDKQLNDAIEKAISDASGVGIGNAGLVVKMGEEYEVFKSANSTEQKLMACNNISTLLYQFVASAEEEALKAVVEKNEGLQEVDEKMVKDEFIKHVNLLNEFSGKETLSMSDMKTINSHLDDISDLIQKYDFITKDRGLIKEFNRLREEYEYNFDPDKFDALSLMLTGQLRLIMNAESKLHTGPKPVESTDEQVDRNPFQTIQMIDRITSNMYEVQDFIDNMNNDEDSIVETLKSDILQESLQHIVTSMEFIADPKDFANAKKHYDEYMSSNNHVVKLEAISSILSIAEDSISSIDMDRVKKEIKERGVAGEKVIEVKNPYDALGRIDALLDHMVYKNNRKKLETIDRTKAYNYIKELKEKYQSPDGSPALLETMIREVFTHYKMDMQGDEEQLINNIDSISNDTLIKIIAYYQQINKLYVDGLAGKNTVDALKEDYNGILLEKNAE